MENRKYADKGVLVIKAILLTEHQDNIIFRSRLRNHPLCLLLVIPSFLRTIFWKAIQSSLRHYNSRVQLRQ